MSDEPQIDCPAMIATAASYGVDVNDDIGPTITDDNLLCFVQWCRANRWDIVSDPTIARRVLAAYMGASDE